MAKKSVMTSHNFQDEVTEILVRLPVKVLLRCKSVCKAWLCIISSTHFIKFHLHHAIIASQDNPTLLTLENSSRSTVQNFPLFQLSLDWEDDFLIDDDYDEDFPEHQRHRAFINEALLDAKGQDLSDSPVHFDNLVQPGIFLCAHRVISSYNGIICLTIGSDEVFLWNPSIRKCKKIPAPPHAKSGFLGFGYEAISDDYKVVRFGYYNEMVIVQVYSTNTDRWRAFPVPTLKNWKICRCTNIVVNGVMYLDGGSELISFDLHKEIFGFVSFPNFIQRKVSDVLDFKGSVAMVFKTGQDNIDLWSLKNVSGQMSWTKKFSILADLGTEIQLSSYLGARQFYGRKVLSESYLLYDILYDYENKEVKYYRLGDRSVMSTLKYTESLVSLDGFKHLE